jgi:hypothetical protein
MSEQNNIIGYWGPDELEAHKKELIEEIPVEEDDERWDYFTPDNVYFKEILLSTEKVSWRKAHELAENFVSDVINHCPYDKDFFDFNSIVVTKEGDFLPMIYYVKVEEFHQKYVDTEYRFIIIVTDYDGKTYKDDGFSDDHFKNEIQKIISSNKNE